MPLRSVRELAPLEASAEPARIGPNIPNDLSHIKHGSICVIIREQPTRGQELLMIKRATRNTDRWSGHIALPGGRHDPGETDLETGIRETREEVGLDLEKHAAYVGALDPRLVRVSLGRRIALILRPFVFVLNEESCNILLVPQVTEVAAVFWQPLDSLYDPANRAWESVSLNDRLKLPVGFTKLLSWQTGRMLFDAVDLHPDPSEVILAEGSSMPPTPWKMWGLTLGVMQDLRRLIDPEFKVTNIRLPTLESWDLRLWLNVLSAHSTSRDISHIQSDPSVTDWANRMLIGYFTYVPVAILTGLVARFSIVIAGSCCAYKLLHRNGKL